jgi:hypothetical protein
MSSLYLGKQKAGSFCTPARLARLNPYGTRLKGAAIGAIATKTRDGGHVFLVVGRTSDGRLGRGGNQRDMVCDEVFDGSIVTAFTWPKDYP